MDGGKRSNRRATVGVDNKPSLQLGNLLLCFDVCTKEFLTPKRFNTLNNRRIRWWFKENEEYWRIEWRNLFPNKRNFRPHFPNWQHSTTTTKQSRKRKQVVINSIGSFFTVIKLCFSLVNIKNILSINFLWSLYFHNYSNDLMEL